MRIQDLFPNVQQKVIKESEPILVEANSQNETAGEKKLGVGDTSDRFETFKPSLIDHMFSSPNVNNTLADSPFKNRTDVPTLKLPYQEDEIGPSLDRSFDSITSRDKFDGLAGERNRGRKTSESQAESYEPTQQDPPQDNSDVISDGKGLHGGDNTDWELIDGMARPGDDGGPLGPAWLGNPTARRVIKIPGLGGLDDSFDPNPDGIDGTDHKPGKPQPSGGDGTATNEGDDEGASDNAAANADNWGILGPYVRPQELLGEVLKNVTTKDKIR